MGGLSSGGHRSAWLEIDVDAIRHNVATIRALVAPAAVAPVVKADAYGHGVEQVAPAIADVADALCVATLDEALALRSLVPGRILVLYPVAPSAATAALRAGVELTVMSGVDWDGLAGAAAATGDEARVVPLHLGVETGMHRGGLPPDAVAPVAAAVSADPRFDVAALWSHLASPEDPASTTAQVERFEDACASIRSAGLPIPNRHLAASGGIFTGTASCELVRPGLAIYGQLDEGLPIAEVAAKAASNLRPAMALKARAVAFSDVPTGGCVGYGGTWRATRPSRVAILPIGYGDGYLRGTQPGAEVLLRGLRRPLVGVISMDAIAVDVTAVPGVDQGDEFVLMGRQGSDEIAAAELARARNTIVWEVLSSMAQRVDRVYHPGAGSAFPQ